MERFIERRRRYEKIISVLFSLIFVCTVMHTTMVTAGGITETFEGTMYPMYYKIYDVNGTLKEEGNLPVDDAVSTIQDYDPATLYNGETMFLTDKQNSDFFITKNSFMTMEFGLNRNASMSAYIHCYTTDQACAYKEGVMGGCSISAPAPYTSYYYGVIRSASTEPVTVTYARFYVK